MGTLSDHPDFEEIAGFAFWTGKADPPTQEQWDTYAALEAEKA